MKFPPPLHLSPVKGERESVENPDKAGHHALSERSASAAPRYRNVRTVARGGADPRAVGDVLQDRCQTAVSGHAGQLGRPVGRGIRRHPLGYEMIIATEVTENKEQLNRF